MARMLSPTVRLLLFLLTLTVPAGCDDDRGAKKSGGHNAARPSDAAATSLADARRGFRTKLLRREQTGFPVPDPPPDLFRVVRYDSPAGKLAAYVSNPPDSGEDGGGTDRHPAIIWVFGGFSNSISEAAWEDALPDNDQSARAFREAGVVTMYPSLRGGNDNPGHKEAFFGEVDDVLAAADYLAAQPYVDPARIYLGGHSTGGTLVLLAAACSDRFRAVFSFGPIDDVANYGPEYLPFDTSDPRESDLRAPRRWVHSIRSPTFVFEGADESRGNAYSLQVLGDAARISGNPLVHVHPVAGAGHFDLLDPVTRLIAGKIKRDEGPATNITFTDEELERSFAK